MCGEKKLLDQFGHVASLKIKQALFSAHHKKLSFSIKMVLDWVILFLVFQSLLRFCFSELEEVTSSRSEILQKIEGNIQVKNADSDDWMPETRVCLDGGDYCGYLKTSGDFVIHNIPPGSYLVEVHSPNYVFDPVRIDISSKNGKIRARKVNLLKSTAVTHVNYPLQFQTEKQAAFFEKRESWNLLSTLKNPMVCLYVHLQARTLVPKVSKLC